MSRRMSSQVGLFSAQVSEQMQRLRPLVGAPVGPGEAQQVDLRRAVMATRLLAGSARILNLEVLHGFLDELLDWLQRIEQTARPLTSTQVLVLESVIEVEDAILSHLEEIGENDLELNSFATRIEDLTGLISHNCASMDPRESPASGSAPRLATPTPPRDEGSFASLRAKAQSAGTAEEREALLRDLCKPLYETGSAGTRQASRAPTETPCPSPKSPEFWATIAQVISSKISTAFLTERPS